MRAYLETCFRLRWLWWSATLAWLVVALVIVRANLSEYEIVTRVWLRPPIAHTLVFGAPPQRELSAYQQSQILSDLIRTDALMTRITNQTSLQALANTAEGRQLVRDYLVQRLVVIPQGNNLFELRLTTSQPDIAVPMITGVVGALTEVTLYSDLLLSELSLQYYGPLLTDAEQKWLTAMAAAQEYLRNHPEYSEPETAWLALVDSELLQLQGRERRARQAYEEAAATVNQIELAMSAREVTSSDRIVAIDPPIVSIHPLPFWKIAGLRLVATMVLMLCAVIATIVITTWTDPSARSRAELMAITGRRVLGYLPVHRPPWWSQQNHHLPSPTQTRKGVLS